MKGKMNDNVHPKFHIIFIILEILVKLGIKGGEEPWQKSH